MDNLTSLWVLSIAYFVIGFLQLFFCLGTRNVKLKIDIDYFDSVFISMIFVAAWPVFTLSFVVQFFVEVIVDIWKGFKIIFKYSMKTFGKTMTRWSGEEL